MQGTNNKFLVNLLGNLNGKQLFFVVWAAIVGGFILMMMAYYRKYTRSNFRRPEDGVGPRVNVDARRLVDHSANKKVVSTDNRPTK